MAQDNGDITIINGSSYRNELWLPLDKKNDLTVELIRATTTKTNDAQKLSFYPRTFSVSFDPDEGSTFNNQCLNVDGIVTAPAGLGQTNISNWGNTALTYNTTGNYAWDLSITNSCGPLSGNIVTQFFRPDGSAPKQYHHIKLVGSTNMINLSN